MQHLTVGVLREGFRRLREFRVLYEETGQDTLRADGMTLCLWDLEFLYDQRHTLTKRQREAIEWFLVEDVPQVEVAQRMGVAASGSHTGESRNPVATYATDGLKRLLEQHQERVAA